MSVSVFATSLTLMSTSALAQVGTGSFQWQISTDNGASWRSGDTQVPQSQAEVQVRALVSWSFDSGHGFYGAMLDIVITGEDGAGIGDTVTNMSRPAPFEPSSTAERLSVQRFGSMQKIDDARDTLPPGTGPRWAGIFQGSEATNPRFTRDNPVSIFEFTLELDGSQGTRRVSEVFLAQNRFNNIDRLFGVWTSTNSYNVPSSTRIGASITVIPVPSVSVLVFTTLTALAARRRR